MNKLRLTKIRRLVTRALLLVCFCAGLLCGAFGLVSRNYGTIAIQFLARPSRLSVAPKIVDRVLEIGWDDGHAFMCAGLPKDDAEWVFTELLNRTKDPLWGLIKYRTVRGRSVRAWSVECPAWLALLVLAAPSGALLVREAIRNRRLRKLGCCKSCGYDLTGNVSGRCPECGAATESTER